MTNIVKLSELSPAARVALINCQSSRQGTPINRTTAPEVRAELAHYGLIGTCDGLTRAGQIRREDAMREALDAL